MQINLLPVHYRPKPAVRVWPIVVSVVLMLNLIIISSYWLSLLLELATVNSSISSLQAEANALQRQVDEAEWKSELAEEISIKVDYAYNMEAKAILWYPLLDAVERAMIPDLALKGLSGGSNGVVNINGATGKIESVAYFLGSLQTETRLEDVRFNSAAPNGSFQITMTGWYGREMQGEADE